MLGTPKENLKSFDYPPESALITLPYWDDLLLLLLRFETFVGVATIKHFANKSILDISLWMIFQNWSWSAEKREQFVTFLRRQSDFFSLSLDRFKLGALLVHIFGYIVNLFWINHFCGPNVLLWNWSWIAVKWSPRSSLFLFAAKTFFNIVEFQQSYCFLYLILLEIDTFLTVGSFQPPNF